MIALLTNHGVLMDQHQIDLWIAKMSVGRTYKSPQGSSWGVALVTEIGKQPPEVWGPVMNYLTNRITKDLKLPPLDGFGENGNYYGVSDHEVRIAPVTAKVTREELLEAVNKEIRAARARVAGKHVSSADIQGGEHHTEVALQAGGKKSVGPLQV
jgi:hypothetical protein